MPDSKIENTEEYQTLLIPLYREVVYSLARRAMAYAAGFLVGYLGIPAVQAKDWTTATEALMAATIFAVLSQAFSLIKIVKARVEKLLAERTIRFLRTLIAEAPPTPLPGPEEPKVG